MDESTQLAFKLSHNPKSGQSIQHNLYQKYSSSQIYFFTNKINQIVKQKRTYCNIIYQDIEYWCDQQQFLKRWYNFKQYDSKMATFKEYYFYHQDCPRIFMKGIQQVYTKWQDKKRDLVYKKLKLIYNEDYETEQDQSTEKSKDFQPPISHFLLDISQYNPYSKKYYLRVQAKKQKEQALKKQQDNIHKSRNQISFLQHDLSLMLNNLKDLSIISTLNQTPKKNILYQSQNRRIHQKNQPTSHQLSNNAKSHSTVKFNFKKRKDGSNDLNQQSQSIQLKKKNSLFAGHEPIKKQETNLHKQVRMQTTKLSPKFSTNLVATQNPKNQSIFSVSSFGVLNKKPEIKINNKREMLKINFQPNKNDKQQSKQIYQSQKPIKIIVKSQSQAKVIPQKQSLQKIRVRQISVGKLLTRQDQFSDKKFTQLQNKLRSHKSEFSTSNSLKKPLFKIKQNSRQGQNLGRIILDKKI